MSIVQLVDMESGQTLVTYVFCADYPTEAQVEALETVVEFDLLRDTTVANFCRHHLLLSGGCDVCRR